MSALEPVLGGSAIEVVATATQRRFTVEHKKYRPDFPARFGSIQDVRAHCHIFFPGYNVAHHHSGLGLLTPHDVHFGLSDQRMAARATGLAAPRGGVLDHARPGQVFSAHRSHLDRRGCLEAPA